MFSCEEPYVFAKSRRIELICDVDGLCHHLIIYKIRQNITKSTLDDFQKYEEDIIKKMYQKGIENIKWRNDNKCYTYVYINIEHKIVDNIDSLKDIPLNERIDSDISLGHINEEELNWLFNKNSDEELNLENIVKFDSKYENLDFEDLIDDKNKTFALNLDKCNYTVDIEKFNGTVFKGDSQDNNHTLAGEKCCELLYDNGPYMGYKNFGMDTPNTILIIM